MHLAASINEGYLLPLLVALGSLAERLSGPPPLLHLLHSGLSAETLDRIGRIVEVDPVVFAARDLPAHPRFPAEAAAPLVLGELLPETVDRVLFIDADLLVLDDVRPLWEWDLRGKVVGACQDAAIPNCGGARAVKAPGAWGVDPDAAYFNAGVLLVDLLSWRAAGVAERAVRYLQATGDRVDFLHQEALNAVLSADWQRLPARWNLLGGVAGRRFDPLASDAWRRPAIVHFAGRFKPWCMPIGGRFDAAYREALARHGLHGGRQAPGWRGALYSRYDRTVRDVLYPLERMLWRKRLL